MAPRMQHSIKAVAGDRAACEHSRLMSPNRADADIVTSAWMAAGMTSRARRPLPSNLAG